MEWLLLGYRTLKCIQFCQVCKPRIVRCIDDHFKITDLFEPVGQELRLYLLVVLQGKTAGIDPGCMVGRKCSAVHP